MTDINQLPEFRAMPQVAEKLLAEGTVRRFAEGETVLRENAHIRSVPFVLDGAVRVIRPDSNGREVVLYYITPGESCIMSVLGGLHRDTSKLRAVAEEDSEVLLVPVERVAQLFRENPQWLGYVLRLYHRRFEELLDAVDSIAFKKLDERLLALLQKKGELAASRTVAATHEQLATELGTARVVVSRLLKQMEDGGLVRLGRNKIQLL